MGYESRLYVDFLREASLGQLLGFLENLSDADRLYNPIWSAVKPFLRSCRDLELGFIRVLHYGY